MSTRGGQSTGKWVSRRVLQQQQHTPGTTGKVVEDSAIAAASRARESEAAHSAEVEVPVATSFEVQEATDALSNLYHNTDYVTYALQNDARYQPEQASSKFHDQFLKQLDASRR